MTTFWSDARPMASRRAVCAESATAKWQSCTSVQAFSGSQITQNSTASTSSGTRSLVRASSAPNGVAFMRWSTRSVQNSNSGMVKNSPGPARRSNRPRRMTTTRSQSMHTCTEDRTVRPTITETMIPANVNLPSARMNAASTTANATRASTTEIITAPFRVAFFVGSERYASAATPNSISERRYVSFCSWGQVLSLSFLIILFHPPYARRHHLRNVVICHAVFEASFHELFDKRVHLRRGF